MYTPSGAKPVGGWPVVILGHGSTDNVYGGPLNMASEFASRGFATIAINFVGNGFGANSTLTVTRTAANGGAMTFPSGGRGVDVDGNGTIDAGEGAQQGAPIGMYLGSNASKQSSIDVLQLVQVIKAGVDVDGDGKNDLDGGRQYYTGFSLGAFVGVSAFTLEPSLRAASFTGVGGWPQLSFTPASRGAFGAYFQNHLPSLLNPAGTPVITNIDGVAVGAPFFNENLPAPGQAPIVNTVAGAVAIQGAWERFEWLSNTSMPGAYAPHLRMKPLTGSSARPFIVQISRGDMSVPNPQTADFIDAGMLADRATLYRNDLFSGRLSFKNPHPLLIRTDTPSLQSMAIQMQTQIGTFFQSDGATVIDPDGAGVLFETPASFIPRDTAFIP
jgi:dienelactone hydrolase